MQDGEAIEFRDLRGQDWRAVWHAPSQPVAPGRPHGAAAVCFTADGQVVVVSADRGATWELPGGRPEPGEDALATLRREVLEEACATVESATLLANVRSECVRGAEQGTALVRSLWCARVVLQPWHPRHETTDRRLIAPAEALDVIRFAPGMMPIYRRWLQEAGAVFGVPATR